MASINRATLIGHLGKDPKVAALNSGSKVVSFSIATSESWKDKNTGERRERTQWHNVVIFNEGLCGIAERFLKKGSQVYIEGSIETRKYTDQAGTERFVTEIVLRQFQGALVLLDKQDRTAASPDDYGSTRSRETGSATPDRRAADPEDDIPF